MVFVCFWFGHVRPDSPPSLFPGQPRKPRAAELGFAGTGLVSFTPGGAAADATTAGDDEKAEGEAAQEVNNPAEETEDNLAEVTCVMDSSMDSVDMAGAASAEAAATVVVDDDDDDEDHHHRPADEGAGAAGRKRRASASAADEGADRKRRASREQRGSF